MHAKLLCVLSLLFALTIGCGSSPPPPPPHGAAGLIWSITGADRAFATCTHAGAASISAVLRNRASGDTITASFSCPGLRHKMDGIPVGAYDVALTLLAADGATLATTTSATGAMIVADQTTEVPPMVFAVELKGRLSLSLQVLTAPANCTSPTIGGAGISGVSISIEHAAGGCAPVMLTRRRGGMTVGTYAVRCDSPSIASCIETDETLSIDDIESGAYLVHVGGRLGPVRCWSGDDVLSAPAGGALAKTIQLTKTVSGC
jgi:hypothetical protein